MIGGIAIWLEVCTTMRTRFRSIALGQVAPALSEPTDLRSASTSQRDARPGGVAAGAIGRVLRAAPTGLLISSLALGCNALLGNEEGVLVPGDSGVTAADAATADRDSADSARRDASPIDRVVSDETGLAPPDGAADSRLSDTSSAADTSSHEEPDAYAPPDSNTETDGAAPIDAAPPPDSSQTTDAQPPPDAAAPADADQADQQDAGLPCGAELERCNGACFDLSSAAGHCGQCNHDCGGGLCSHGVCQPVAVLADLSTPKGLAVDSTSIYFISSDNIPLSCSNSRCSLAPTPLASDLLADALVVVNEGIGMLARQAGSIYWYAYACPKTGCPSAPASLSGSKGSSGLLLGLGNTLYWTITQFTAPQVDSCQISAGQCGNPTVTLVTPQLLAAQGNDLFLSASASDFDAGSGTAVIACTRTDCANTKRVVVPTFDGGNTQLGKMQVAVQGTTLYSVGRFPNAAVETCPVQGCTSWQKLAPFTVANPASMQVTEIAVDATDVYWTEAIFTSTTIKTCPLTGCGAGPRKLAQGVSFAYLRVQDGFAYWVAPGEPVDGGGYVANSGAIMRVRK